MKYGLWEASIKVVLLAGGLGTRLSEETDLKPKPMVQIGGEPILSHVMGIYSAHGLKDFIVCCGYRGNVIKRYYADYYLESSDIRVDLGTGSVEYLTRRAADWRITMVDTGQHTMTGGRIKRVASYLENETFCATYGDGLGDIDISELIAFHKSHGCLATVTAVPSPGRFGVLEIEGSSVSAFTEKPRNEVGYINGGFFVLEPGILDYIQGDETTWEHDPLQRLAADGQLRAYVHHGFWKPMDTLRDKNEMDQMVKSGSAPWMLRRERLADAAS